MDYGLLQGIGEGLKSGVGAYQAEQERRERTRQRDIENKMRADEREMILADKGLIKNDSGKYEKSPEKIAEESAKRQQERMEKRNNIMAKYADMGLVPEFDDNDNIANVKRGLIPQKAYTPLDPISAAAKSADIRKTEAEIAKISREGAQGQRLPADKVLAVQEGQRLPLMLEDIKTTLSDKEMFGPVKGLMGTLNPYDTKSKTADAQISSAAQAFGRYMEGGVLRKEDEAKYRKMFPNLTDTPEVAANKLALVERMLKQKQAGDVQALGQSGYDVSGIGQVGAIPNMPGILAQKSGGLIPEAQASQGLKPGTVENGYRYKGGDPANPNSWEKL